MITYTNVCTGEEIDFDYRVNSQGLNYMKYDATTYERDNCSNLCYSCGGT